MALFVGYRFHHLPIELDIAEKHILKYIIEVKENCLGRMRLGFEHNSYKCYFKSQSCFFLLELGYNTAKTERSISEVSKL